MICSLAAATITIHHREHKDSSLSPPPPSPTGQRPVFIKSAEYHNPESYVYEDLSSLYASHDDASTSLSSSSSSSSSWNDTTTDSSAIAVCKLHSNAQELNHFPHFMQPMHQCIDYWIHRQQLYQQQHQQQEQQHQRMQAILIYDHSLAKNLAVGLETCAFIQGIDSRSKRCWNTNKTKLFW
jgi:hypothetical protein